jgi:hypothetical protein
MIVRSLRNNGNSLTKDVEYLVENEDEKFYYVTSDTGYSGQAFFKEMFEIVEENETPKHYDNTNGSLYKVAEERGWNSYVFDIIKRLERAEKKGEFDSDLDKSINVIKLWKKERSALPVKKSN